MKQIEKTNEAMIAEKRSAVLRVLRGESAGGVASELGVTEESLQSWCQMFVAGRESRSAANSGKTRRRYPLLWKVVLLLLVLSVTLTAGVEVASRALFVGWFSGGKRPLQPYYGIGNWYEDKSDAAMLTAEGPQAYGYREQGGVYLFDFEQAVDSIGDRADFLFQERVELANSAPGDGALRIFILGGSAATGYGATDPAKRWFAVLEEQLGQELRQPIEMIPAAMSGYVSTQERLVLELAILERNPDVVIVLTGWNDAALPAHFASRPGDPYNQGVLYKDYYSAWFSFKRWFSRHSVFCRAMITRNLRRGIDQNRERILNDPALLENYAASTASVFLANIQRMKQMCQSADIRFLAFLQPTRALSTDTETGPHQDALDQLTAAAYHVILDRQDEMDNPAVIDLTGLFDDGAADEWYLEEDPVHFGDRGQAAVATAVRRALLDMLSDSESAEDSQLPAAEQTRRPSMPGTTVVQ